MGKSASGEGVTPLIYGPVGYYATTRKSAGIFRSYSFLDCASRKRPKCNGFLGGRESLDSGVYFDVMRVMVNRFALAERLWKMSSVTYDSVVQVLFSVFLYSVAKNS